MRRENIYQLRVGLTAFLLVTLTCAILVLSGHTPITDYPISSNSAGASSSDQPSKSPTSDSEKLNVSTPSFGTAGVRFSLNDTRPNTALWVSIKVGKGGASRDLMSWVSSSDVKSGDVSIPFQDFKYDDAGMDVLAQASACEVTIGARLKEAGRIVYAKYDVPIYELRAPLLDSAR